MTTGTERPEIRAVRAAHLTAAAIFLESTALAISAACRTCLRDAREPRTASAARLTGRACRAAAGCVVADRPGAAIAVPRTRVGCERAARLGGRVAHGAVAAIVR